MAAMIQDKVGEKGESKPDVVVVFSCFVLFCLSASKISNESSHTFFSKHAKSLDEHLHLGLFHMRARLIMST